MTSFSSKSWYANSLRTMLWGGGLGIAIHVSCIPLMKPHGKTRVVGSCSDIVSIFDDHSVLKGYDRAMVWSLLLVRTLLKF
jgi:hypothetical protein